MKKTLPSLSTLYDKLNQKYFNGKLPDSSLIRLEWSKRLITSAGRCRIRGNEITVSLSIDYHMRYPEEIEDTLLHEQVHINQALLDKTSMGHGASFKKEVERINKLGGKVNRYSKEPAKKPRWLYTCSKCSNVIKRYRRIPETYACGICKSKLIEKRLHF